MSILNRILAGSGDEGFKKGTFISATGTEVKFATEKEPSEYILMMVANKSLSTTVNYAFLCHTNAYDRLYRMYYSFTKPNYSNLTTANPTASYSGGVLTLSVSTSGFYTGTGYVLYYR